MLRATAVRPVSGGVVSRLALELLLMTRTDLAIALLFAAAAALALLHATGAPFDPIGWGAGQWRTVGYLR
jgi:hypothetical protein